MYPSLLFMIEAASGFNYCTAELAEAVKSSPRWSSAPRPSLPWLVAFPLAVRERIASQARARPLVE